MLLVTALALIACWLVLIVMSTSKKQRYKGRLTKQLALDRYMTSPFLQILERSGLFGRFQLLFARLQIKLVTLSDGEWSGVQTKHFIAQSIASGYAVLTAGAWLACMSGEAAMLGIGAIVGIIFPASKIQDVFRKVERRRQNIVLKLPDVLSKIILLVGAGETVQSALNRSMGNRAEVGQKEQYVNEQMVLYREWAQAMNAMQNGLSFSGAIEQFNRRCAVQEVAVFTTVLLLNYRRGGDQLVLSLRELSISLWEKRKAAARSRGEEASSKLIFPLVGVFVTLLIIVAAPAIMLMGQ